MSLVWAVFLCIKAVGQPEGRLLTLSAFLGALLFRPFVTNLTSGQLAPLLLLLLAGGVSLYTRGRRLWAGLLFACLLLKPNLVVLFLPACGLLLLSRRDWQGLLGLGLGAGGLLVLSWLVRPGWPLRWLQASAKTSVTFGTPTLWGLIFDLVGPEYWIPVEVFAVALMSGVVLLLIVRRCQDWLFGMGLAMCASLLATPYLWNYDQLLLLAPALIAFGYARGRYLPRVAAYFAVLFVLPWGLFWVANLRGIDL